MHENIEEYQISLSNIIDKKMKAIEKIFKPFYELITEVAKKFVTFKDKHLVKISPVIGKWDCVIKKQLDDEINNLIKDIVNFKEEINEKITKLKEDIEH